MARRTRHEAYLSVSGSLWVERAVIEAEPVQAVVLEQLAVGLPSIAVEAVLKTLFYRRWVVSFGLK